MDFRRVKISTTVPIETAEKARQALGEAGAGDIGEYTFCSFSAQGVGRFKPSDKANPYKGKVGQIAAVQEEQIEVVCDRSRAKQVLAALKKAHPYEEVIVDIVPLLDEEQL